MKKLISVVALAMVMIMTMAVSVFADDPTVVTSVSVNGVTIPTKLEIGQEFDPVIFNTYLPNSVFTPANDDLGSGQGLLMALTDQQKIDFAGVQTIEFNGYTWAPVVQLVYDHKIENKPIVGTRYAMSVISTSGDELYVFDNSTKVTLNGNDYSSSKVLLDNRTLAVIHDLGVLQSDGTFSNGVQEVKNGVNTADHTPMIIFALMTVLVILGTTVTIISKQK